MTMKQYGLIGKPLSHSFSQRYFTEKFQREGLTDCSYSLWEIASIAELPDLLQRCPDISGFNVTAPYKEAILSLLDHIDGEAAAIGAVNAVRVARFAGKPVLTGYNTDAAGFRQTLEERLMPSRALVLGTGGAGKAITHALHTLGIATRQVSRVHTQTAISYEEVDEALMHEHLFIVNCTPLGTAGPLENALPPLPYQFLTPQHQLYDLVYNPATTPFLLEGRVHHCQTQNGLAMLYAQAEISWKRFTNVF